MSAAHSLSSSSLVASPVVAPNRRRANGCAVSRGRDSRAVEALAQAVEPLERRVCLSVSFSGPVNWPADDSPISMAIGDFNGDGNEDLVTANNSFSSDDVTVLLGSGTGGFSAPAIVSIIRPISVAVGDFDGDGNHDLVVVNDIVDQVSILVGDGSGGFSAPTHFPVGDRPVSVAIGDFDGNGSQDLAVANFGDDNVTILLGNGSIFVSRGPFAVGEAPRSVAVADFNGDGHPDLAVANGGSASNGNVSVLLGDGAGNFGTVGPFSAGFNPAFVTVGDFNEDGRADLAAVDGAIDAINILLGDGNGAFAAPLEFFGGGIFVNSVAVGDFDGDGHADLAAASRGNPTGGPGSGVTVLLGDGTGDFASAVPFAAGNALGVVSVADFNGDGRPDLAATNGPSGSVSVLLNTTIATPELANVAVTSSVLEDGIATLTGDISHADPGRSFTLVVDWGDGSTPQEFNYPVGTTSFGETHQYLDDDPTGTSSDLLAIHLIVTDDAGGSTDFLANVTVENVAPEVTLSAGGSAVRGVPLAFAGAFTDVGTLDNHEVAWDFGDGTVIPFQPTTDPGALTPTHAYAANGTYLVTMTVRDDDTGTTAAPTTVFVSAVGLIADPSDPGGSMLVVGGTAGDDDIRFSRVNKSSNIDAFIGAQYLGRFNPTSRLVVFAGAGNDTVAMDKNISLSAILLGGDGDDVLTSGNGRDILIGGTGADGLNGGGDDDILIGGTTAHDANLIGLGMILNEWTRSLSLANRVNNLKSGGGLSGGFALNSSTVFDDGANDVLTGGAGKDWFLFGNGDVLTDLSNTEAATFI